MSEWILMNNLSKSFPYGISVRRLQFFQTYSIFRIKIASFKKLLVLWTEYELFLQSIHVLDA